MRTRSTSGLRQNNRPLHKDEVLSCDRCLDILFEIYNRGTLSFSITKTPFINNDRVRRWIMLKLPHSHIALSEMRWMRTHVQMLYRSGILNARKDKTHTVVYTLTQNGNQLVRRLHDIGALHI